MTDFTSEITALQRARVDMQTEKATNKITVKAKYAERIRQEIADADEAAEIRFARLLATAANAGIPQSILRSEVLRTNDWSRWVYWRDLAEIEPERIVISNAKAERARAESPFQFSADYSVLTVTKDSTGAELAEPVVYDMTTNQWADNKWWPNSSAEGMNISDAEKAAVEQDKKFRKYVSDYIQTEIDNETITNPRGN